MILMDNNYIKLRDALYNCSHNKSIPYVCEKCPYYGKENCEALMQMDAYEMLGELYTKLESIKKTIKELNIT